MDEKHANSMPLLDAVIRCNGAIHMILLEDIKKELITLREQVAVLKERQVTIAQIDALLAAHKAQGYSLTSHLTTMKNILASRGKPK